jgi:predicted Zn-dependent protease
MRHTGIFLHCVLLNVLLAGLVSMAGCSGESDDNTITGEESFALDLTALYSEVDSIVVQVGYEPDAEPFTGTAINETQCWAVLEENMQALYEGRIIEPDIFVPKDISEMVMIPAQEEETWTAREIIDLAGNVWDRPQGFSAEDFYVLFLNGYLEKDGMENRQVIGASVVGTPVMVAFKDAILRSSNSYDVLIFVEQATLVHEFGHVMGLVDNGIPMVSDHLDPDHLRHCTNEECVMYWQNEGAADLKEFVAQMISTGSLIMYGEECLKDTHSYMP